MEKPKFHLFLCNSYRVGGDPQGSCNRKGGSALLQYLQDEVADRGIDAMISTTSCLNVCEKGPILVVYPNEWWYAEVTQESIDQILDALEAGSAVEDLLMA